MRQALLDAEYAVSGLLQDRSDGITGCSCLSVVFEKDHTRAVLSDDRIERSEDGLLMPFDVDLHEVNFFGRKLVDEAGCRPNLDCFRLSSLALNETAASPVGQVDIHEAPSALIGNGDWGDLCSIAELTEVLFQQVDDDRLRLYGDHVGRCHVRQEAGADISDVCPDIEQGVARSSMLQKHLDVRAVELSRQIDVPADQLVRHHRQGETVTCLDGAEIFLELQSRKDPIDYAAGPSREGPSSEQDLREDVLTVHACVPRKIQHQDKTGTRYRYAVKSLTTFNNGFSMLAFLPHCGRL